MGVCCRRGAGEAFVAVVAVVGAMRGIVGARRRFSGGDGDYFGLDVGSWVGCSSLMGGGAVFLGRGLSGVVFFVGVAV